MDKDLRAPVKGIVIDPGHGGEDPGAVSGNIYEKDYNLKSSKYMYDRFKQLGIPVAITRDTDKTLTKEERTNKIKQAFGNTSDVILLSNHINAGGGEGAEIVYALRNSDTLAKNVLEEIGKEGQLTRKYYQLRLPSNPSQDYYYIMRDTKNVTPLLIEYGFLDNKSDVSKLDKNLLNYAEAVVRAVAKYAGVKYVPPIQDEKEYYIVQKGDTLFSIANMFGLTVKEIKQLNNLTNDFLQLGQRLLVSNKKPEKDLINYTVQRGESLYSIANKFNTTVSELTKINNLTSTVLSIGQVLKVPGTVAIPPILPEPEEKPNMFYTVQRGDSLYSIANKYNINVNDLIKFNNLTSTILSIGQILEIPKTVEPEESYINYTVQRGDSLYSIANRFNTTVNEIIEVNKLSSTVLSIGQLLKLPQ